MAAVSLVHLPPGSDIFLDANIFYFGLLGQSSECIDLLQRCVSEDVFGVTTIDVINEATHKLMLAEACAKGMIRERKAAQLRQHLPDIRLLFMYWVQVERILQMNLIILQTGEARLRSAHQVRLSDGLLTNDSLIVAAMRDYGLTSLASTDRDFDHVSGLTVYMPSDLPKTN